MSCTREMNPTNAVLPEAASRTSFARWGRAILGLMVVSASSIGCDAGSDTQGEAPNIRAEMRATVPINDAVLGFESVGAWSTTTAGATLGQSTTHSQGANSLSVRPSSINGYTPIASTPLGTLASVSSTLALDVMLPTTQVNPWWYGTVEVFVNCPSRGIYSQALSSVDLTGKPLNVWTTLSFPVSSTLVSALRSVGYTDLVLTIVINVSVPTAGTYYVDNLRFLSTCSASSDCTGGKTCVNNQCVCPASTPKDCGGTCIASSACCSSSDCAGGMTCSNSQCLCASGTKGCNGTCIASSACCSRSEERRVGKECS